MLAIVTMALTVDCQRVHTHRRGKRVATSHRSHIAEIHSALNANRTFTLNGGPAHGVYSIKRRVHSQGVHHKLHRRRGRVAPNKRSVALTAKDENWYSLDQLISDNDVQEEYFEAVVIHPSALLDNEEEEIVPVGSSVLIKVRPKEHDLLVPFEQEEWISHTLSTKKSTSDNFVELLTSFTMGETGYMINKMYNGVSLWEFFLQHADGESEYSDNEYMRVVRVCLAQVSTLLHETMQLSFVMRNIAPNNIVFKNNLKLKEEATDCRVLSSGKAIKLSSVDTMGDLWAVGVAIDSLDSSPPGKECIESKKYLNKLYCSQGCCAVVSQNGEEQEYKNIGAHGYSPPEGHPYLNIHSYDAFSLGVVILETLGLQNKRDGLGFGRRYAAALAKESANNFKHHKYIDMCNRWCPGPSDMYAMLAYFAGIKVPEEEEEEAPKISPNGFLALVACTATSDYRTRLTFFVIKDALQGKEFACNTRSEELGTKFTWAES